MPNSTSYIIPEEFRMMADHAGPLALKLAKRLHGKPDCLSYDSCLAEDLPAFIHGKLIAIQDAHEQAADAINQLASSTTEEDIRLYMENIETILVGVLETMDEVKCACFDDFLEAKPLVLAVMGKIVQETILMLQTLHVVTSAPDQFVDEVEGDVLFDLSFRVEIDEEVAALQSWADKQSKVPGVPGWGMLLIAFGAGWWLSCD